jgi:hypothetical protein
MPSAVCSILVVAKANPLVSPCDPQVAVGRLAENVDPPHVRGAIEPPRLMDGREQLVARVRDGHREAARHEVEVELRQRRRDPRESVRGRGELEVVVLSPLSAEEEVDRPARRHPPGDVEAV